MLLLLFAVFIGMSISVTFGADLDTKRIPSWNIFQDPHFWQHFETEVYSKAWSCDFQNDILRKSLEKDAVLYEDDSVFRKRRYGAQKWASNSSQWIETVLGACKELSNRESGKFTHQLQHLRMLEAFADFVDHLIYFQMVADKMASLGEPVKPISQQSSKIHDIDKLDPVMMVGYSEKFEDKVNTSVWNLCVNRHTRINPHHQAHCVWHGCCDEKRNSFCDKFKKTSLREMVCDKVSRRVQKNLDGQLTRDMWDVDIGFFDGLPEEYLHEAEEMLKNLKGNDTASHSIKI